MVMVMVMAMADGWGIWGWFAALVAVLVVRVFWVVQSTGRPVSLQPGVKRRPMRTLVVLGSGTWRKKILKFRVVDGFLGVVFGLLTLCSVGSGGHTAEMMSLVEALNLQWYAPRHYIAGATDKMSLPRAEGVEARLLKDAGDADGSVQRSEYSQIFRSREVGQSYLTSMFTTLWAFVHAVSQVLRIQPDVILCNGPGTCLPICVAGFLMKVVGWKRVVVVYVESIARVKKLSLTGLLLYKLRLADQFFVQWKDLKVKYPRSNYVGRLM
ncbi:hypothetical protein M758_5G040500 [Ceratodon purpureus]|nr:hypothetical protein M758_5G040500 [Ceratodon purpureus]